MPETQPLQLLSSSHLGALLVTLIGSAVLTRTARCRAASLRRTEQWLAAALLLMYPAEITVASLWGKLDRDNILPLHLCDVVAIIAAFALLTKRQSLIELAYFWGLAGTLQGLLTPSLSVDFPHPAYFRFFALHGLVVVTAVYLTWGLQRFPRRGSVWRALLWCNVYLAAAAAANALLGSNYGYTCRKPANPSLMDLMGPWPWYLLAVEALALGLFLLLDLPFRSRRAAPAKETGAA